MGTVHNKWLAINFMMGYLNPKTPASEHVSSLVSIQQSIIHIYIYIYIYSFTY